MALDDGIELDGDIGIEFGRPKLTGALAVGGGKQGYNGGLTWLIVANQADSSKSLTATVAGAMTATTGVPLSWASDSRKSLTANVAGAMTATTGVPLLGASFQNFRNKEASCGSC